MRKLDPTRLRNPVWFTVIVMMAGAGLGVVIGSFVLLTTGIFAMLATGPLGFLLYGPLLMAQTAASSSMGMIIVPAWAWFGGWFFAAGSVGNNIGVAARVGMTLFSEGHPVYVRINELARELNLPPIRWVGWYEGEEINAFAMGVNRENALIAMSKGAIDKLTKEELDAVMAHELAHVANNDMARMTYARGVQNALTWFLLFRGFKQIALWVFTPTSQFELMRFSRTREYWADAIGAVLTSPQAMAGALRAIDMDQAAPPAKQTPYANIMLRANAHSWLATHPPIEDRISAVIQQTYIEKLPFKAVQTVVTEEPAAAH
ncbi:M48 family metalloprotease [Roseibium sp. AS2]|uniref:M48 family metalloprotease n=1 Tax=Roseibium sp. AS2 TaxID=3135781 RepID=UPI00317040C1